MTAGTAAAVPADTATPRSAVPWVWASIAVLAVCLYLGRAAVPWAVTFPEEWTLPAQAWVSRFVKWLYEDASLGLFTFQELTRAISWVLQWPLQAAKSLLSGGFVHGMGQQAVLIWPPLSWVGVIGVVTVMSLYARDWRLGLLVSGCFLYIAVFGQWHSAMITLSSIVIAVPLGVAGGLLLGILAFRHPMFERAITPIMDLMQTVPVFAYLVPILVLFGFNPVAAMIATIIYALPPMVRNTTLALRRVPTEIVEFGRMAGCSRRQLTWRVMVPAARGGLMIGVNQVIMLSLNMVIIASMIGAGGLGRDVLTALRTLNFGAGLEASIAITLLAIALDRLSQAYAARPPSAQSPGESRPRWRRHPYLLAATAVVAASWLLGWLIPAVQQYPEELHVTTGPLINETMKWLNVNFFDLIEALKAWVLLNFMVPIKRLFVALPWAAVVAALAYAGWRLGRWKLALLVATLAGFIAVTGQWEKAMQTLYLCGLATLFACALGIPIGILAARHERLNRVVQVIIDTLQTLPAFAYLMPVVMLFRVGDFTAMLAVIAYAIVFPIRYTIFGIRQIDPALVEAAVASGCTRRQLLWKVQLPLAFPEIMLGVNQTILMALSMLVITALVGTRELGQEVYIALAKADVGRGVVAGVCIAFMAIIADRLIQPWVAARRHRLGIA